MNKQDAIVKVAAMETELAALRKIIEEPEQLSGLYRFGPKGQGFYTGCAGDVLGSSSLSFCPQLERFGNCFPSREIAEKASALMARSNKIISAALQASGGDVDCFVADRFHSLNPATCALVFNLRTREQSEEMARILKAEGIK